MKYSVITPAYNEEACLPATLEALRESCAAAGIEAEFIVVDNASTDATAALAQRHGAMVVHEPVRQIARARNAGAARAGGDFLLFVDADTRVPPETLRQMDAALRGGTVCGGGALIVGDRPWKGFARFLVWFWTLLSRTWKLTGGSFLFATREAFAGAGGFDETVFAGEEVWLVRRLKTWGRRRGQRFVLIEDPPVVTSTRKDEMFSSGQLLLQFLLILLVPWITRHRRFCWIWYHRPGEGTRAAVPPA